jgi:hypothetical protein
MCGRLLHEGVSHEIRARLAYQATMLLGGRLLFSAYVPLGVEGNVRLAALASERQFLLL